MKRSNPMTIVASVGGFLLHAFAPGAQAEFSAAAVHRAAAPAVVIVLAGSAAGPGGFGAGSVVAADGLVLTSDRLVVDPRTGEAFPNLRVVFKPQQASRDWRHDLEAAVSARVVARDEGLGLALVRATRPPNGTPVLALGRSDGPAFGATVASLGHPEAGGPWILTPGTLLGSETRAGHEAFVVDIESSAGNTGAPLLDARGALIGVSRGEDWVRGQHVEAWLAAQGREDGFAQLGTESRARASAADEAPRVEVPALLIAHGRLRVAQAQREAPRGFKGPNGEEMYGMPRRDFRPSSLPPGPD